MRGKLTAELDRVEGFDCDDYKGDFLKTVQSCNICYDIKWRVRLIKSR